MPHASDRKLHVGVDIEEEMTFEELSSKLGGLTGGDHRQFATEDSMGPAPNEHPMAAAILNNNTNKNNMAFNDVNSAAQISVCTPFDSWLDGGQGTASKLD